MKITVIGGSPKGKESVTIQYVNYIKSKYAEHQFDFIYPAQKIRSILSDDEKQKDVFDKIRAADFILWAFPLYYMSVHGNLKRFIELCYEKYPKLFRNKYAACITTSIHFYDHTAHNYIQAVSEDLGMHFIGSHSPKMNDLLKKEGQVQTDKFACYIFRVVEEKISVPRKFFPLPYFSWEYKPGPSAAKISTNKKIVAVTDCEEGNPGKMISYLKSLLEMEIDVVNLSKMKINGGCLGCLKCGPDNICSYEGKDEYIDTFRGKIMTADILIWAGKIKDRYLSWEWKQFLDRSFFNTHQPVLAEKQFIFLVSGPLSYMGNLKEMLTTYVEMEGSRLAALVSDECRDSFRLNSEIESAVRMAIEASVEGYVCSDTFRSTAGRKIFRDDVYEGMKVVFRADHRTYKKIGYYDFQGRSLFNRLKMSIAYLITSIPFIKKGMFSNMVGSMVAPFRKITGSEAEK